MPIYEHQCEKCNHIWEDLFSSWRSPVPEECPNCKEKGHIKRLTSWCSGKVEYPFGSKEHVASLKEDARKIKQQAKNDENLRANIIGEDRYHQQCCKK